MKCSTCGHTIRRERCSNPGCRSHQKPPEPSPAPPPPPAPPEPEEAPDEPPGPPEEAFSAPPEMPKGGSLVAALQEGAVLIRRAANGWILEVASGDPEDPKWVEVYQDFREDSLSQSESLMRLLLNAFGRWMASGEQGGLLLQLAAHPDDPGDGQ